MLHQVKFNFELRKRTNGLVVFCPFQHPTTSPVISDISHSRFNVQPCHSDISHSSSAAGAHTSRRRARRVYVLFRVAVLCYVSPSRSFCLMLRAVGPMKLEMRYAKQWRLLIAGVWLDAIIPTKVDLAWENGQKRPPAWLATILYLRNRSKISGLT